jgi:peptidoglycan/xylan/chitin deacetylase (PgdA/CDA1 family)
MRVPIALLAAAGRALPKRRREAWGRFLAIHAYWLGVRRAAGAATYRQVTAGTPILMYHAFCERDEEPSRFVLRASAFDRQLRLLRLFRYRPLRLSEYVALRRAGAPVPAGSVVLTIDDGYRDAATLAVPRLVRHRMTATLFVVTGHVGETNAWDAPDGALTGRPLLSWAELGALPDAIELGAHTRGHVELPRVDEEEARAELAGSKEDIERALGRPAATLAYPHGATNARVQALAADAGFAGSCTGQDGLATAGTPIQALRRIEIRGTDSLFAFALKLALGRRHL